MEDQAQPPADGSTEAEAALQPSSAAPTGDADTHASPNTAEGTANSRTAAESNKKATEGVDGSANDGGEKIDVVNVDEAVDGEDDADDSLAGTDGNDGNGSSVSVNATGAQVFASSIDGADLRLALELMETSAAEDLHAERRKHSDEVANLHRLLQESQQEAQTSLAALQQERAQWSLSRAEIAKEVEALTGASTQNLEAQLQQSQLDVARLKQRLDIAVENAGPQAVAMAALLGVEDTNEACDESVRELERMDFERCPVSDLRMYMMALITQKRLLQEDNLKLSSRLEKAETERMSARDVHSPIATQALSDSKKPSSTASTYITTTTSSSSRLRSDVSGHSRGSHGSTDSSCAVFDGPVAGGDGDAACPEVAPSPVSPWSHVPLVRSSSASALREVENGASSMLDSSARAPSSASAEDLTMSRTISAKQVEDLELTLNDHRLKLASLSAQLAESRTLCSNYELQLQQAQGHSQLSQAKQRDLEEQLDKYLTELTHERERVRKVEEASEQMTDDLQSSLAEFVRDQSLLQASKNQLTEGFAMLQDDCREQMDVVIQAKDKVALEMAETQDEYREFRSTTLNRLATLNDQLAEEKELRTKAEKLISQLNQDFQRQYGVAEENRVHLAAQLETTSVQLRSEQLSRHEAEQQLKLALVRVQAERDDTKVALATEQRHVEQLHGQLKDVEHQLANLQGKTKEIILALQTQLEQEKSARATADERVVSLRGQLENMRQQLDSSQLVQQDFVRLSQNLQVQLANMVDKQREVRWEHEDDVETCRGCEKLFSVTRRKHHCRQCGKIFCSECSAQTVSGRQSQRPMRVCDPCFTSITTDAPMQFGMDTSAKK